LGIVFWVPEGFPGAAQQILPLAVEGEAENLTLSITSFYQERKDQISAFSTRGKDPSEITNFTG
jgi:hypothetical protein